MDNKGALDFNYKCEPGKQPSGFQPWYTANDNLEQDWTVVFGHWSTLGVQRHKNTICLDSGCLWGGRLTAARLGKDKPRFYSVHCVK